MSMYHEPCNIKLQNTIKTKDWLQQQKNYLVYKIIKTRGPAVLANEFRDIQEENYRVNKIFIKL